MSPAFGATPFTAHHARYSPPPPYRAKLECRRAYGVLLSLTVRCFELVAGLGACVAITFSACDAVDGQSAQFVQLSTAVPECRVRRIAAAREGRSGLASGTNTVTSSPALPRR